ncbi:MAG: hypothetical protein E4H37_05940 [Gemmatimonadales bacterium]|nr:MAG: hypothetical protein E4H37_05940 [Gemmatimonadales bacterium]
MLGPSRPRLDGPRHSRRPKFLPGDPRERRWGRPRPRRDHWFPRKHRQTRNTAFLRRVGRQGPWSGRRRGSADRE